METKKEQKEVAWEAYRKSTREADEAFEKEIALAYKALMEELREIEEKK